MISIPLTNHSDAWWWWDHGRRPCPEPFLADLTSLRELMALNTPACCDVALAHRVLILVRARADGNARSLADPEGIAGELEAMGVPSALYEPGAHTPTCQAAAFGEALGVVGVRGAEFANLIWMRPGRPVLMIQTPMPHPWQSPQPVMAPLLGLPLTVRSWPTTEVHLTALDVRNGLPGLTPGT